MIQTGTLHGAWEKVADNDGCAELQVRLSHPVDSADSIRYYTLCRSCAKTIIIQGIGEITHDTYEIKDQAVNGEWVYTKGFIRKRRFYILYYRTGAYRQRGDLMEKLTACPWCESKDIAYVIKDMNYTVKGVPFTARRIEVMHCNNCQEEALTLEMQEKIESFRPVKEAV